MKSIKQLMDEDPEFAALRGKRTKRPKPMRSFKRDDRCWLALPLYREGRSLAEIAAKLSVTEEEARRLVLMAMQSRSRN